MAKNSSFLDQVEIMQAAVDGGGVIPKVTSGTHGHASMVKNGYLRPGANPLSLYLTWNGYKWAVKMWKAGFITTEPVEPGQQSVSATAYPPQTCTHCGCPCPCDCHHSSCPPTSKKLKAAFTAAANTQTK